MEEEHTYELPNLKEAVASCDVNSQYEILSNSTSRNVFASATPHQDKSMLKKPVCSWLCMCALVGFILVGSAAFASLALTVWNFSQVNHQGAKLEMVIMQLQRSLFGLETPINDSVSEYERRITQLQNFIFGLDTSVNGSISELGRRIKQLPNSISGLEISVNGSISELKRSIKQLQNSSASEHERIEQMWSYLNDHIKFMRRSSGWTRVAFLNMSDPNQVCPSNWTTIGSPVRTCGMGQTSRGYNSVFYSTLG